MFLLDTDVVSELWKVRAGKADPRVGTRVRTMPGDRLFLSAVVVLELEIGVLPLERRDPVQGAILRTWLDNHVLPAFADRILPVDLTVARKSASLHVPNPQPIRDALIAATALVHSMILVTRNVEDFAAAGTLLLNPWEAPSGS